jgi:hypothetical protein
MHSNDQKKNVVGTVAHAYQVVHHSLSQLFTSATQEIESGKIMV